MYIHIYVYNTVLYDAVCYTYVYLSLSIYIYIYTYMIWARRQELTYECFLNDCSSNGARNRHTMQSPASD